MLSTLSTRPGSSLALLGVIGILAMQSRHSGYQSCGACSPTTHNIADPTLEPYLMAASPCTDEQNNQIDAGLIESGTPSVRAGKNNIVHGGRASVVGQYCQFRGCSGPNCVAWAPQNRNVQTIGLRQVAPSGTATNFPLKNLPEGTLLQIIDSDSGMTNGPQQWSALADGAYSYMTNVLTTLTWCEILPTTHPFITHDVNVMACKPAWLMSDGDHLRGPLTNVTLNVPSSMNDAFAAAEAAATSMTSLGLGITVNVVSDGTCSGGACINLTEDLPVTIDPSTKRPTQCGAFAGGDTSPSGVYQSPSRIRFLTPSPGYPYDWRDTHPQTLQRRIAHELLHYFGLQNRQHASCTLGNTVMTPSPALNCHDSTAPPTGTAIEPSWSDGATVKSGPYGQPPNRKLCGW